MADCFKMGIKYLFYSSTNGGILQNRLMKNVAIYLCLPFTILSVLFLNDFVYYFVQEESRAILDFPYLSESIRTLILDWGFRSFYFGAQLLIGLVIPATIFFGEKHRFNWQDKTEKQYFFISLPFIIIASMPTYALQSLFGFASGRNNFGYSFAQLVWTSLIVVEIIAIYNIFKNKDYQTRYELCVFYVFSSLCIIIPLTLWALLLKSCLFNCVILQHTFS